MANIRKIGKAWVVGINRRGIRKSKSFYSKQEAKDWAHSVEADIVKGLYVGIPNKPFSDVLKRYKNEVSINKKGFRWESIRINRFLKEQIAQIRLPDFDESRVAQWRDKRIRQVSSATVNREWNLLSHICSVAYKEWKWMKHNPFSDVRRPVNPKPRTRRPSDVEIEAILYVLGYDSVSDLDTITKRVGAVWLFAMETAMRSGEIVGMEWKNVYLDEKYCHLPDTKNGYSRNVPLSTEAVRILKQLQGVDDCSVFKISSRQLDALFRKGRDIAMVEDLHFHDSRREALTRLSKRMGVMELAKISGHRDLRVLQNTYYNPSVQDLVRLLE